MSKNSSTLSILKNIVLPYKMYIPPQGVFTRFGVQNINGKSHLYAENSLGQRLEFTTKSHTWVPFSSLEGFDLVNLHERFSLYPETSITCVKNQLFVKVSATPLFGLNKTQDQLVVSTRAPVSDSSLTPLRNQSSFFNEATLSPGKVKNLFLQVTGNEDLARFSEDNVASFLFNINAHAPLTVKNYGLYQSNYKKVVYNLLEYPIGGSYFASGQSLPTALEHGSCDFETRDFNLALGLQEYYVSRFHSLGTFIPETLSAPESWREVFEGSTLNNFFMSDKGQGPDNLFSTLKAISRAEKLNWDYREYKDSIYDSACGVLSDLKNL